MKKRHPYRLLLSNILPLLCLGFRLINPPDVAGAWRMAAHRVAPTQDSITDLYAHFKDLYGGCEEDMGLTLNTGDTLKMSPVKGCRNPLGNLIMKVASKFMPSGKSTWQTTDNKIVLQDGKGLRREYDLQLSGTSMQWGFDEIDKQATVRHTIGFKRE